MESEKKTVCKIKSNKKLYCANGNRINRSSTNEEARTHRDSKHNRENSSVSIRYK